MHSYPVFITLCNINKHHNNIIEIISYTNAIQFANSGQIAVQVEVLRNDLIYKLPGEIHKKNAPEHYSWFYWIYDSKDKSEIEINKQHPRILPKDW